MQITYAFDPKRQIPGAIVAFAVSAGLNLWFFGAVDWPISIGITIGVLLGLGIRKR